MTIKDRIERLEEALAVQTDATQGAGQLIIYDVDDPPDFEAVMGVRVHCLALGGVDLTSPAGKMTMGVLNAVAEFERDLLIERTQSGLDRLS
ncbi:DNA invertase [Burkholderia pseudomallei]|nr:hypothetical protein X994_2547 [Burkholderia pseudomallei]AJX78887.1 hypothetical protein BG16_2509 [Burkholderia pseudomallei MSHR2543]KGD36533.1 hypothetical protein DO72_2083 [Burkholderia pseudomallei]KGU60931.1 hypothetical protein Y038_2271 [Burkholderia pseudomallei MSHR543]KGV16197.1 hypothetical protein X881_3384 [Burkholderia pseudomallei MSHR4300]